MNVTFSILMCVFGLLSFDNLCGYLFGKSFTKLEFVGMIFFIIVTAISAGVVFGGLFQ